MNPDALLSQLRDIHAPEAISWWPLAPGWWVLLILTLALLGLALRYGINKYQKNAWRRSAKKELEQLQDAYQNSPNAKNLSAISALLKRCIATLSHDRSVLSYSGKQWFEALSSQSYPLTNEDLKVLTEGQYQPNHPPLDKHSFSRLETWIKGLKA